MKISIIAACNQDGIIGVDGKIPWRSTVDMKEFRRRTDNSVLVMGRKTYESLPLQRLINREIVVVSRDASFRKMFSSKVGRAEATLPRALAAAVEINEEHLWADEIFVAGGRAIYAAAMDHADAVYLTLVEHEVAHDLTADVARFPLHMLGGNRWKSKYPRGRRIEKPGEPAVVFFEYERDWDAAQSPIAVARAAGRDGPGPIPSSSSTRS